MDHLHKFSSQVRLRLIGTFILTDILVLAVVAAAYVFDLPKLWALLAVGGILTLVTIIVPLKLTSTLIRPVEAIWQAILHIAPDTTSVPAPDMDKLRLGREMVATLVNHVYQTASVAAELDKVSASAQDSLQANFVANNLPLPLIIIDEQTNIIFSNDAATDYLGMPATDLIAKNVYSMLDMSFSTDDTLDNWLSSVKNKTATASKTWDHVRLKLSGQDTAKQFDLAAYYNQNNPQHIEIMLVLFDQSARYGQTDQSMDFLAMSVHELRTPLTILRGYIEALEEELRDHPNIDPELRAFILKMSASAQQLSAFVNNILNVARVDGDQMTLQLREEKWGDVIKETANSLALRARVRDITLEYSIAPDLPTVGVDRVSIQEVINNLVDNAIKYSGAAKRIRIDARMNQEGMVETSVQDFGVGIPTSIVPNLFSKFYRNHRNRSEVGGTGLGLYLSKAIVAAHGGNIWVRSKEGEGTTLSFTIQPFAMLAEELKNNDNKEITRGAHGWIKNHSLYRR